MKKIKKILSGLLVFCLTLGIMGIMFPAKAEAAWNSDAGLIKVWHLDGDFKDGKYRINIKIQFDRTDIYSDSTQCSVSVENARLVNSSGKTVLTWKNKDIFSKSGVTTQRFAVDFSKLKSDTYTFKYTLRASINYFSEATDYSLKVNHAGNTITYKSSKYTYDTNGNKKLKAVFNIKEMKGYVPKVQVYNSKGKVIRKYTKCGAVKYDSCNYTVTWDLRDSEGDLVSPGTYTVKITCNGKSCSKKFKVNPEE